MAKYQQKKKSLKTIKIDRNRAGELRSESFIQKVPRRTLQLVLTAIDTFVN